MFQIKGNSFSSNQCENRVVIGGVECPVIQASVNEIVCKLDSNSGLIPNEPYNVELAIKNIGYAIKNGTFSISFLPAITAISSAIGILFFCNYRELSFSLSLFLSLSLSVFIFSKWCNSFNIGSVAGGTKITIDGSGFLPSSTVIYINDNNQFVNNDTFKTNITYNKIILTTNANTNVSSQIIVTSKNVRAVCLAAACVFEFSQPITPLISSVAPNILNASSLISITGNNFGTNLANVNVKIGKQNCIPDTVTNQLITCLLNGLNLGNQNVLVNILG